VSPNFQVRGAAVLNDRMTNDVRRNGHVVAPSVRLYVVSHRNSQWYSHDSLSCIN